MLGFYDRWLTLLDIPVPVIAAIEGECIGVAPIFACASDVAIADDTAKFQITFTALGLFPGMAMAYRTVICTKMPYPYDQRCRDDLTPVRSDRQACEDDAERFNSRVGPVSNMHSTCESFIVDCSLRPLSIAN